MNKTLIFGLMLSLAFSAMATGPIYDRTKGTEIISACTNATQRTDGSALPATEIAKVEVYYTQDSTLAAPPALTVTMTGGCIDTPTSFSSFPVNPANDQWFVYGKTFDKQGRVDGPSASFPFVLLTAPPKAPVVTIK